MAGIIRYFDQLEAKARRLKGDRPEHIMLRAFREAGVPTSTFYRTRYGAEIKGETAAKVAEVLDRWANDDEDTDAGTEAA